MANPVADLVAAFGGLTKASRAIGAPITTIDSWRTARRIPPWRLPAVREAARRAGIALPKALQEEAA